MSVVPLLRHPDEKVRRAAVKFLDWSLDKRVVDPLCKALDLEKDGDVGDDIGRAPGHLQDPRAVPALKRAVKRGIDGWTGGALGTLGDESCYEILLEQVEKQDSMAAAEGLRKLIHRSNKKPEPWMSKGSWSKETGLMNKDKWRKWWGANKRDFKVIKTFEEAYGPDKPARKP